MWQRWANTHWLTFTTVTKSIYGCNHKKKQKNSQDQTGKTSVDVAVKVEIFCQQDAFSKAFHIILLLHFKIHSYLTQWELLIRRDFWFVNSVALLGSRAADSSWSNKFHRAGISFFSPQKLKAKWTFFCLYAHIKENILLGMTHGSCRFGPILIQKIDIFLGCSYAVDEAVVKINPIN